MWRYLLLALTAGAALCLCMALPATAGTQCGPSTVDFEAGPIWDNEDAKGKCPKTCEANHGSWNGQWRTTVWGKMSVCGCDVCCKDVDAGPIWNNADAKQKCPEVCKRVESNWNGQWVTTVPCEMSVCGCCGKLCDRTTKDIEAGPIWDNEDAQRKCPQTCGSKDGKWNGQWRTTEWGKMSVCGCVLCG